MASNKYFLYARKSQERDDRQIVSLKDQIRDMKSRAAQKGLKIIEVFEESKSAKKRGRPIFNEMIRRIKKGEANGILCWKLNRLARNSFDGGEITDLLQEGIIAHIETYERGFYPEDNVMYMLFEFGMATQYSKDLGGVVKRGLREKAFDRRWYPISVLPAGYLHYTNPETKEKSIIIDTSRYYIVQELWGLFASGAYSIAEIRKHAKLLGLKNQHGNDYSHTTIKRIFSNPFYTGYFFWRNEENELIRIKGKHQKMITEAQFLRVQQLLSDKGRDTRSSSYFFPYRGILKCGECSGSISAERKYRATCEGCKFKFSILHKKYCTRCGMKLSDMKNPTIFEQIYYGCIKYSNPSCSQKVISEEEIEKTIIRVLEKINIDSRYFTWLRDKLSRIEPDQGDQILLSSLKNKRRNLEGKIKTLVDMKINDVLSTDQFILTSREYENELKDTNEEINRRQIQMDSFNQNIVEYIDMAHKCVEKFKNASAFEKKRFVEKFLSNPRIYNKALLFSTKNVPSTLLQSLLTSSQKKNFRTQDHVAT